MVRAFRQVRLLYVDQDKGREECFSQKDTQLRNWQPTLVPKDRSDFVFIPVFGQSFGILTNTFPVFGLKKKDH